MKMGIRVCFICLIMLVIAQLAIQVGYAKVDPKTIVGTWLLDEGQGDVIRDSSGNGNNGKIAGAAWVAGKYGKALAFDGSNSAEIPATASTDNYVDGFTYLLWVKPTGAQGGNTRVMERDWHNPAIQIEAANFYGSIVIGGVEAGSNVRGGTWVQDEWSFVALTWDGSVLSLYVNDKMVAEKKCGKPDMTKNNNGGSIWLAKWKGGAGWDYKGVIDEVAVFSAALSAADLKTIMNNGLDKYAAVSSQDKLASTWGQVKER
jgi:hypothetical protein